MSCCETQNLAVGYGAPLLRDIALHAERGKFWRSSVRTVRANPLF